VEEHDGSNGDEEYIPKQAYNFSTRGFSEEELSLNSDEPASSVDNDSNSGYKTEDLEW
jgi:hypothetical protein